MDSSKRESQPINSVGQPPRRIAFLLIDGFALMSYSSAVEPLRAANLLNPEPLYEIHHLVVAGTHAKSSSGAEIEASLTFDDVEKLDDIFIVAGGDPTSFEDANVDRWLRRCSAQGCGLVGFPVGRLSWRLPV